MGELYQNIEIDLSWVDRRLLEDAFLTLLIVGTLTAIHYGVSQKTQTLLAFDHEVFRPWSIWTSAYVHQSDAHLWSNISGFLLAVVVVYRICWLLESRRWFRWTIPVFLFVLPVLVNLSSYAILGWLAPASSPTGRGFSGIVAGLVGFLFTAFLMWVASILSQRKSWYVGQAVVLILVWELAIIYRGLDVIVIGLVGIAFALIGTGIIKETEPEQRRINWKDNQPKIWLGVVIVGILTIFVMLLFPSDFITDQGATNIFAHATGMIYGAASAYVVQRLM